MNKRIRNLISVIAAGFIVMLFYLLVLLWGRSFCWGKLINNLPEKFRKVTIMPSGLVPGEPTVRQSKPQDKNEFTSPGLCKTNLLFSDVSADLQKMLFTIQHFGVVKDLIAAEKTSRYRELNERKYYWFGDENNFICFDKSSGQIIKRYELKQEGLKEGHNSERIELFAGSKKVSETADASLGKFFDPVVGKIEWAYNQMALYDRQTRCFYIINFDERNVKEVLQLAKEDNHEPMAAGVIQKGDYMEMDMWWSPPREKDANDNWKAKKLILPVETEPNGGWDCWPAFDRSGRYITVLDKSGRIYQIDSTKPALKEAGYLPFPKSLFLSELQNDSALPNDLLAYEVVPVYAVRFITEKDRRHYDKVKYLGMCVGTTSREGTSLAIAVFDPNGRLICRDDTEGSIAGSKDMISSAEAIYSEPSNSLWTAVEYILENLQPPVLEAASYLCAYCFEASAGHRAIFILPNSFVGMLGRGTFENFFEHIVKYFLLTGLSLVLSVWLAFRIRKDAILVGLSRTEKKWWLVGTILFGLPAYITYRLTRPKEMLVSCQNCGKMRRPDMETCHHCGSKWEVPELTPPNWRIKD